MANGDGKKTAEEERKRAEMERAKMDARARIERLELQLRLLRARGELQWTGPHSSSS